MSDSLPIPFVLESLPPEAEERSRGPERETEAAAAEKAESNIAVAAAAPFQFPFLPPFLPSVRNASNDDSFLAKIWPIWGEKEGEREGEDVHRRRVVWWNREK